MVAVVARKQFLQQSPEVSEFEADVLEGLHAVPKHVPAKYFYDATGSRLFERITELPEYYPTRCEMRILRRRDRVGTARAAKCLIDARGDRALLAGIALPPVATSQNLPDAPSQHRLWDKPNQILFFSHVALEAADFGITHRNLSQGGKEMNPMGKTLCESGTLGQLAYFCGRTAGVAGVSYLLHRMGLTPRQILRRRGTPYDELGLAEQRPVGQRHVDEDRERHDEQSRHQ